MSKARAQKKDLGYSKTSIKRELQTRPKLGNQYLIAILGFTQ